MKSVTDLNQVFNQLEADIKATKRGIELDYRLVKIYIEGNLRDKFNGVLSNEPSRIRALALFDQSIVDNNKRFCERWDTAASTIAEQTASRFRLSLLPDGLDSISVIINGTSNSAINDFFTDMLKGAWPADGLTQINQAVMDYLNYGTACMTSQGRHVDINKLYFWELMDTKSRYVRAYLLNCDSFNTEFKEPKIIKIDPGFLEELERIVGFGLLKQRYLNLDTKAIKKDVFYWDKKGKWKEYDRSYMYEQLYVAKMGNINEDGYGTGCGVNALGPVIQSNYIVSTEYLNLGRINDPVWNKLMGVEIQNRSGSGTIDTYPGATNIIKSPSGIPMNIDQMVQRDQQGMIELQTFLPLREQFLKELDAAYNSYLFKPFDPVPQNTAKSATEAIIQLQDTINAYRSKADAFLESIIKPMAKFLLLNTIALKILKKDEKLIEQITLLAGEGLNYKDNVEIQIKDYSWDQSRRLKAMEIQEELGLTSGAIQAAQLDPNLSTKLLDKIKKIYS